MSGYSLPEYATIAAGFVRAKAIDELAQIGLLEAVTATRKALLEQLRHRQQDTDATSTAGALIIAGLAVSILVPGAGPLVAASMAAISGGLSYAGSVQAEREAREEQRFEGRSADDLSSGSTTRPARSLVAVAGTVTRSIWTWGSCWSGQTSIVMKICSFRSDRR